MVTEVKKKNEKRGKRERKGVSDDEAEIDTPTQDYPTIEQDKKNNILEKKELKRTEHNT